ncbi:hypothetical protein ACHHYP_08876 [Achlya hypogyna]|uniref:PiggyBac transposable element-derived protein 4 C-terminal zinc-ribbon domain-containing protein n=1 Tax=Achlya hypogyna TaxID=1202772 RepID=A0A1V9YNX5_ACHHY|nr:hypothetical protein ACHHYP_08876 [Achlya hypogyna]
MTGISCRKCLYSNPPPVVRCVMCDELMPSDKEKVVILAEQVARLEGKLAQYINALEPGPSPASTSPPPSALASSLLPANEAKPLKARMVIYNKRDQYFRDPSLIARRRDPALGHTPELFDNHRQLSCVWCCRSKHNTAVPHSRHGFKTSVQCTVCKVALCQRDRGQGTCFELFHTAECLNEPCVVTHDALSMDAPAVPRRKTTVGQKVPRVRSKSGYVLTTTPKQASVLS